MERFRNQSGIIAPDRLGRIEFTVVGAGAIGSFLTLGLAKMGATKIKVFDGDTIEEHNIATQFYPENAVGIRKVTALRDMVAAFSGVELEIVERNWTPKDKLSGFVISCVDSMAVRKSLYGSARKAKAYFVDGRMGAEVLRTYSIDTTKAPERKLYENTLYSDEQAVQERCVTQRSIIFTVFNVVGHMLNAIKKAVNSQVCQHEVVWGAPANLFYTTTAKRAKKAKAKA